MSLKAFKDLISRSFEQDDVETVNGLHSKLKDRLSELLTVTTSSTNDHLVVDEVLNAQWKSCQTNLGLKLSKLAAR